MGNKRAFAEGLAGLMNAHTQAGAQKAAQERKPAAPLGPQPLTTPAKAQGQRERGNYKTVCYSLPPVIAERIKAQAAAERRTIGAVVAQALEDYIEAHGGSVEA